MKNLSERPSVHPTAEVRASDLGRYTEIGERCHVYESVVDDYSYLVRECEVYSARIGKFSNIASHVRINATNHPIERARSITSLIALVIISRMPSTRSSSSPSVRRAPSPSAMTPGSATASPSCPA